MKCPHCNYILFVEDGKCRTCRQSVIKQKKLQTAKIVQCTDINCESVRVRFCHQLRKVVCMVCGNRWDPNW